MENEVNSSDTGEREKSPVVTDDNSASAKARILLQNEETEKQKVNSIETKKIPMYSSLEKIEIQPECSFQDASSIKQEGNVMHTNELVAAPIDNNETEILDDKEEQIIDWEPQEPSKIDIDFETEGMEEGTIEEGEQMQGIDVRSPDDEDMVEEQQDDVAEILDQPTPTAPDIGSKSVKLQLKGKHSAEGQKEDPNPPKKTKIQLETTAAIKIRDEIVTLIDMVKSGSNKIKEVEDTVTDVKSTVNNVEKRLEGLLECPEFARLFRSSVPASESLPGKANHITGLRNERGHCYLNTTVQIIANIKQLWLYFVSEEYFEHLVDDLQCPVAPVFADLILRLKSDLVKKVNPKNFIRVLGRQLTFVDSDKGEDSCHLLTELLHLLSKELRKRSPSTEQGTGEVEKFYLLKKKNNPSIIFELFTGVGSLSKKCIDCGSREKELDIVDFLTLEIPNLGTFSLEDCLKINFQAKIIKGRCQKCTCLKIETTFCLAIIPQFVIIRINNAMLNQTQCLETQRHLVLEENIRIPEFQEDKVELINYRLKAIAFSDRSKPVWHAFAGVVSENCYTLYNDEVVSEISFDEVVNFIWDYLIFQRISKAT